MTRQNAKCALGNGVHSRLAGGTERKAEKKSRAAWRQVHRAAVRAAASLGSKYSVENNNDDDDEEGGGGGGGGVERSARTGS